MSGSVDVVGLDNLISLISERDIVKVSIRCGKEGTTPMFEESVEGEYTQDDLLHNLQRAFAYTPTNNFKKYTLKLSYRDKNNKVKPQTIEFALNQATGVSHYAPKEEKSVGTINSSILDKYKHMGMLEAENQFLREKLAQQEEEDDEDDIGAIPLSQRIADVLLPLAPQFLAGVMNWMNKSEPQHLAVAGIPSDAGQLLNEMITIEPEFPEHLSMLINLRKNKPAIYTMALNQLKQL